MKINLNKKILIPFIAFFLLVAVISVVYLIANKPDDSYKNNPGGTGGDYSPANIVSFKNGGVLYDYLGQSGVADIKPNIELAVLYDTSISTDPESSSDYEQASGYSEITTRQLYKKDGTSYTLTIDDDKINFDQDNPWDYWFTFTTNDGRHFRVGSKSSNFKTYLYIKKTD